MADFSHFALQKAIYETLTADSTLMALVEGIYDRVPQDCAFPYISIGEAKIADWSTKTTTGTEQLISLYVCSREGGRKQAATIMERIHTLLHNASPAVDGQALISLRFVGSSIELESDGWTYRGMVQLRALLETNA